MRTRALIKRFVDVTLSLGAMPLAAPIMVAFALATVIESPGNPLFFQRRVGKDGRQFTLVKLRTMIPNAENIGAGLYNEENDPRYTKIGTVARRFSVDELPQLINVLQGHMSIVGPRPQLEVIVNRHQEAYRSILQVKPGLTGLAQVSGRNALTRQERLLIDIEYAQNWSLAMDASIILRTVRVVIVGEGQLNSQSMSDVEK